MEHKERIVNKDIKIKGKADELRINTQVYLCVNSIYNIKHTIHIEA